jgi:hypothetical protein
MELAIYFTLVGTLLMAGTVIADKLTLGDLYEGNTRKAWFVSSALGAIIGLIATYVAWIALGNPDSSMEQLYALTKEHTTLAILMFLTGAIASLSLPAYFKFLGSRPSTSAAIAIAATPAFVFAAQKIVFGQTWLSAEVLSVIVAVGGFILYEWFENLSAEDEPETEEVEEGATSNPYWWLVAFVTADVTYLVLMEYVLGSISTDLSLSTTVTGFVAMPLYWLGFAIGALCYFWKDVSSFVKKKLFKDWRFVALILGIELIGGLFYYFELLGVAGLDVSYATLIIGAHVIGVYLFDLYIRHRLQNNTTEQVSIFFFKLAAEDLAEYNKAPKWLWLQFFAIIVVLIGLALWP